jgi:hypothetical protein
LVLNGLFFEDMNRNRGKSVMAIQEQRHTGRLSRKDETHWVLNINNGELVTKNVVDLSPRGLAFKAPKKADYKRGQRIQVNLKLEHEAPEVECTAEVVWVKPAEETLTGTSHHLGLQFVDLPAQADEAIMKRMNKIMLDQRRREVSEGKKESVAKRMDSQPIQFMNPVVGMITVAILIGAFMAAVLYHESHFPQDTLAYKFQTAPFWKKQSSSDHK